MRNANCRTANRVIYERLAEIQLSEHERQLATYALRDAEAMMHAVIWVKERFAAVSGLLLKPVFRNQ